MCSSNHSPDRQPFAASSGNARLQDTAHSGAGQGFGNTKGARLRALAAALSFATPLPLVAQAQTASPHFIQRFLIYYGGGPALTSSNTSQLAKYDLIDIDRFRYADIAPTTWAAVKTVNPNVQFYLYEIGPEVYNNQDSLPVVSLNSLGRYNVSRRNPMGSLNGNLPQVFQVDVFGKRIYSAAYSNPGAGIYSYLMDFGSSTYQSYWVSSVQADIANQPWVADGVFADNCLTFPAAGGYRPRHWSLWANCSILPGTQRWHA